MRVVLVLLICLDASAFASEVVSLEDGSPRLSEAISLCTSEIAPYSDADACLGVCPSGKEAKGGTADDRNECVVCGDNTGRPYADHISHQCVTSCPAGQAPDSSKDCSACGSERPYADHDAHQCVATCPDGSAPNTAGDCTKCSGATPYADHNAHSCVAVCPAGQAPTSQSDCSSCPLDSPYADHTTHTCVSQCAGGQAPDTANDCVSCPVDSPYSDRSTNKCVAQCSQGRAPDGVNNCVVCAGLKPYADLEAHICVSTCGAGMAPNIDKDCFKCCGNSPYADHSEHKCVAECAPGQVPNAENSCTACTPTAPYADRIAQACVSQCPAGKAPNDSSDCVKCEAVTPYADHESHACVASCPEGTAPRGGSEANSNDCTPCAEGLFADHSSHTCVEECPTGFLGKIPGDCVGCDGERPLVDRSTGLCVADCGVGSGIDSSGLECEVCTGNTPLVQENACVSQCAEGSRLNEASKECEPEPQLGEVAELHPDPCATRPYLDGAECVSDCPSGKAPKDKMSSDDANRTCTHCCDTTADTPTGCASDTYADHTNHVCVASCPPGRQYTLNRDCVASCPDVGLWVLDGSICVKTCPNGQAPDGISHHCAPSTPTSSLLDLPLAINASKPILEP